MLHHLLRSRFHSRTIAAAALVAIAAAGDVQAQGTGRATKAAPRPSTRPAPRAAARPDTTALPVVLVEEDVITFIDQPTASLVMARAALARHDAQTASRDVAAGAAFLRVHAGAATGTARADLLESAQRFDGLALDIRRGEVRSPDQFDGSVRGLDGVLARHHWERATHAWERRETAKAGQELRAAADATERAAHRAGLDTEVATRDVVRGARLVSGKLIDGAGWTVDEVGKGIADLGAAIDRLGHHLEPRR
jgi:hypothetical protein